MKKLVCLIFALAFMFVGCAGRESEKTSVVATLFPQYDLAREIAGDRADVELLLDFGADAHSYDPTPADVMKIANADLFIYTGEEMELWAEQLLARMFQTPLIAVRFVYLTFQSMFHLSKCTKASMTTSTVMSVNMTLTSGHRLKMLIKCVMP